MLLPQVSSESSADATPVAVLLSALLVGRLWARCMLGSDLLRQVKGVGPITALAYALTLEN